MPPEGGEGGNIPLGAEKRMWYHDRASLIASWYAVPPVRRSQRCAWGLGRGRGRGAPPQDALAATQRRNGRAFSSLTARGGGLPVGSYAERYSRFIGFRGLML